MLGNTARSITLFLLFLILLLDISAVDGRAGISDPSATVYLPVMIGENPEATLPPRGICRFPP